MNRSGFQWFFIVVCFVFNEAKANNTNCAKEFENIQKEITDSGLEVPANTFKIIRRWQKLAITCENKKEEMQSLGWLAYLFEQTGKTDSALFYYEKALKISEIEKFETDESSILNNMGALYKDLGKIKLALSFHFRSLKIRKKQNNYSGIGTSLNNIGLIYQNQGKVSEALLNYFEALKMYEQANSLDGKATTLHNIASVYKEQEDFQQATIYYQRAIDLYKAGNDNYNYAASLNSLGELMFKRGLADPAFKLINEAVRIRNGIEDQQGLANSLSLLGQIWFSKGNFKRADSLYLISYDSFEKAGDLWGKSRCAANRAELYRMQKKYSEALHYGLEALSISKKLGFPVTIQKSAETLSHIYAETGKWNDAYQMQNLSIVMRDSVANERNLKLTLQRKFEYEYAVKQKTDSATFAQREALKDLELKNRNIKVKQQRIVLASFLIGIILVFALAVVAIRGRRKSDSLLLNILPDETAEELKRTGRAIPRHYDDVTVLFTDFVGFTEISQQMSTEELVNEINYCFSTFDQLMDFYGLEKIKTIGDSYMAVSGIPVASDNHAEKAADAALAIVNFMAQYRVERSSRGALFFDIRVGLHSGPVVSGVVGTQKFQYDVWGDTVNTASRMESNSEKGKINISGQTYGKLYHLFTCHYRGKIEVKGKGMTDMYFLDHRN